MLPRAPSRLIKPRSSSALISSSSYLQATETLDWVSEVDVVLLNACTSSLNLDARVLGAGLESRPSHDTNEGLLAVDLAGCVSTGNTGAALDAAVLSQRGADSGLVGRSTGNGDDLDDCELLNCCC